jgi:hypothetical protein
MFEENTKQRISSDEEDYYEYYDSDREPSSWRGGC